MQQHRWGGTVLSASTAYSYGVLWYATSTTGTGTAASTDLQFRIELSILCDIESISLSAVHLPCVMACLVFDITLQHPLPPPHTHTEFLQLQGDSKTRKFIQSLVGCPAWPVACV